MTTPDDTAEKHKKRRTPFSELLRRAMGAHLTGRLELKSERTRRRLTFKGGLPVRARSNLVREHLLKFLLQGEFIDEGIYAKHLNEVYEGTWDRGTTLVREGVLSSENLKQAEAQLCEQIMMACFSWTRTAFSFHTLPEDHDDLSDPLLLDPFAVYAKWLEESVSTRRVEKQIGRLNERHMRLAALGVEHHPLVHRLISPHTTFQKGIVERWTVGQLIQETPADTIPTARALLALYHLGAIELVRPGLDIETALGSRDDAFSLEQVFSMAGEENTPQNLTGNRDIDTLRKIVDAEFSRLELAQSPQDVLGVSPASPPSEIRDAYERFERFYHPKTHQHIIDQSLIKQIEDIRRLTAEAYHTLMVGMDSPVSRPDFGSYFATEDLTRSDPQDMILLARVLFDDGRAYLKLGDHQESLSHFKQAHRRDRNNVRYLAYLGWSTYLCASDEEPGAREQGTRMLLRASRDAPDEDDVFVLLGHVYCRNGQTRKGSEMYQKALIINPDNAEAARALEPLR